MLNYNSFSIRPIKINDKEQIHQWRNSERVRCNMYSDHVISQQEHDAWFASILAGTPAHYLIFSYVDKPIGFISFTNVSSANGRCYWAFYLGETDVPRGSGTVMEFFALDYAFLTLKIRKLCCEVFTFNESVIKLHEKFGFAQEGRFVEHYLKNGQYEDIISLAKFGTTWVEDRKKLESRIFGKFGNK
jgi:UDP-4-amino-4,6-dideoxy-N-acetyl-beta-L-altrosamine N-acetyltransferase